jgi:hypothetical protein
VERQGEEVLLGEQLADVLREGRRRVDLRGARPHALLGAPARGRGELPLLVGQRVLGGVVTALMDHGLARCTPLR